MQIYSGNTLCEVAIAAPHFSPTGAGRGEESGAVGAVNSFVVEENLAFDPAEVSFFGADGVVLAADRVADTSTSSVQA